MSCIARVNPVQLTRLRKTSSNTEFKPWSPIKTQLMRGMIYQPSVVLLICYLCSKLTCYERFLTLRVQLWQQRHQRLEGDHQRLQQVRCFETC